MSYPGEKQNSCFRSSLNLLLPAVICVLGCSRQQPLDDPFEKQTGQYSTQSTAIRFQDVASEMGVNFTAVTGQEAHLYSILESLGSGIAFCDFDRDMRPDLAIPGGGHFDENRLPVGNASALFRQTPTGQFVTAADSAGLPLPDFYTHGINSADFDNDGFCDFLFTGFHGMMMLHNNGDGTVSQIEPGGSEIEQRWSTSSAVLDVENDGDLDIYITNYVNLSPGDYGECIVKGRRDVCPPGEYAAIDDQLLLNNGDGTFNDGSENARLIPGGKGLAVISGDLDHDGDCDLYVANDTTPNVLYINDGSGHFSEEGLVSGSALGANGESEGSMGVEFADLNSDGRTDIWVSNYENQSFAMYECRGLNMFQHVSAVRGITAVGQMFVGFGTTALDADCDGDMDLFATNGHVMYHATGSPRQQTPLIFENHSGTRFQNVAPFAGEYSSTPHEGRGLSRADFDSDGRVDVAISHCNAPVALLRNVSETESPDWVCLQLVGRSSNRDAVGAIIRFATGDETTVLLQTNGGSYLSSHATQKTITLRRSKNKPADDSVEVVWPSGIHSRHPIEGRSVVFCVEPLALKMPGNYAHSFTK
jgi:hypothetical protein